MPSKLSAICFSTLRMSGWVRSIMCNQTGSCIRFSTSSVGPENCQNDHTRTFLDWGSWLLYQVFVTSHVQQGNETGSLKNLSIFAVKLPRLNLNIFVWEQKFISGGLNNWPAKLIQTVGKQMKRNQCAPATTSVGFGALFGILMCSSLLTKVRLLPLKGFTMKSPGRLCGHLLFERTRMNCIALIFLQWECLHQGKTGASNI